MERVRSGGTWESPDATSAYTFPMSGVAVKEYDVFGHEVGARRRVGQLHRIPMTLSWDRAQGELGSNVPDEKQRPG